jgi:hypothetical protein
MMHLPFSRLAALCAAPWLATALTTAQANGPCAPNARLAREVVTKLFRSTEGGGRVFECARRTDPGDGLWMRTLRARRRANRFGGAGRNQVRATSRHDS